jgi:hypothetical protein
MLDGLLRVELMQRTRTAAIAIALRAIVLCFVEIICTFPQYLGVKRGITHLMGVRASRDIKEKRAKDGMSSRSS